MSFVLGAEGRSVGVAARFQQVYYNWRLDPVSRRLVECEFLIFVRWVAYVLDFYWLCVDAVSVTFVVFGFACGDLGSVISER